mmetsp:Transcript_18196/g.57849  ORF Transcript_18196/g.57849 Transcript_18196/m.57849 type:complete len:232 (+) Transcript_18196:632-1327(+)
MHQPPSCACEFLGGYGGWLRQGTRAPTGWEPRQAFEHGPDRRHALLLRCQVGHRRHGVGLQRSQHAHEPDEQRQPRHGGPRARRRGRARDAAHRPRGRRAAVQELRPEGQEVGLLQARRDHKAGHQQAYCKHCNYVLQGPVPQSPRERRAGGAREARSDVRVGVEADQGWPLIEVLQAQHILDEACVEKEAQLFLLPTTQAQAGRREVAHPLSVRGPQVLYLCAGVAPLKG